MRVIGRVAGRIRCGVTVHGRPIDREDAREPQDFGMNRDQTAKANRRSCQQRKPSNGAPSMRESESPRFASASRHRAKPRESAGFSRAAGDGFGEVSAAEDSVAERVGFEPTVPLRVHLISSQARSTELRHLSAGAEASKIGREVGGRSRFGSPGGKGGRFAAPGASC